MRRRPPRSTRTVTRFPYTTLFRSNLRTVGSDGVSYAPMGALVDGMTVVPAWVSVDAGTPWGTPYSYCPFAPPTGRSEEHTSELQSLMRISYAVFCLKKKNNKYNALHTTPVIINHT